MDKEEYLAKCKELFAEVIDKRNAYLDAKSKLRELKKEMSYEISKQYEPFIGKKVVIYYTNNMEKELKTGIGYLDCFEYFSGRNDIEDGLYPFLLKPKKDGSKSRQYYPLFDNTRAEVQNITRISVVE